MQAGSSGTLIGWKSGKTTYVPLWEWMEGRGMDSVYWARICKRLRRLGIDSEDSIPSAYVAWRASTTNRVVVPACQAGNRLLGSLKGLQIRAQNMLMEVQRRPVLFSWLIPLAPPSLIFLSYRPTTMYSTRLATIWRPRVHGGCDNTEHRGLKARASPW